jgi:hypothetical protein
MEFYSSTKKNEILLFSSERMELDNIILSEVSQAQKNKNCMFSLRSDFRSRAMAVMFLDLGHTLSGEHIWEVWG